MQVVNGAGSHNRKNIRYEAISAKEAKKIVTKL